MKKRISILAGCVIGILGVIAGVSAAGVVQKIQCELRPDFTVVIDGKEQTFRNAQGEVVYPVLYEGTTYLPVRAIGEMMGKTVYWYENEKRVELRSESTTVTDADVIITGDSGNPQQPAAGEITLEQAKEIAAKKAGLAAADVYFTEARLERDDGIRQYDIEFVQDGVEYSAEIRASDGEILSWDVDQKASMQQNEQAAQGIGLEQAKEIALNRAGVSEADVRITQANYEIDDGVPVYDIEFWYGQIEYSAEIRASDGKVLSWDEDRD